MDYKDTEAKRKIESYRFTTRLAAAMLLGAGLFVTNGCSDDTSDSGTSDSGTRNTDTGDSNSDSDTAFTALALVDARLFDGSGDPPLDAAVVIIRNKQIEAVGTADEVVVPTDARVINLDGKTVLPGLINSHVHDSAAQGVLETWLEGGVTTVRDAHVIPDDMGDLFALRDSEEPGNARVIASGSLLTVPGGYPLLVWELQAIEITSEDQAHWKVRELAAMGADYIKIAVESGEVMSIIADEEPPWPTLSDEELAAVVDEASEVNVRVAAHVTTLVDLERVVLAGVNDIMHGVVDPVPEELLIQMVETNISWVPTLELWKVYYDLGFEEGLPTAQENLIRFVQLGGNVALGTDFGLSPIITFEHGTPMKELTLMEEAGMTPTEVLVAATSGAAASCGREDIGTIAPGMMADLIVVARDPLSDLNALQDILLIVHDGQIIRNELNP